MKAEEFGWEGEEAASASTGLCSQSQHTEQRCREQVPQLCAVITVPVSEPANTAARDELGSSWEASNDAWKQKCWDTSGNRAGAC